MDALKHAIELPTQSGDDDRAFLVSELVPAIRDGLVKLDAAGKDTNPFGGGSGDVTFQGAMLVAYRGKLYQLEGNFQLVEGAEDFASVGCGSALALGSFASTKKVRNPRKRVLAALEASTKNAGCAPPLGGVWPVSSCSETTSIGGASSVMSPAAAARAASARSRSAGSSPRGS